MRTWVMVGLAGLCGLFIATVLIIVVDVVRFHWRKQ